MDAFDRLIYGAERETEEATREAADHMCVELMKATEPIGVSNKQCDKMEKVIEREIKRVVQPVSERWEDYIKHNGFSARASNVSIQWRAEDGLIKTWNAENLALDASQQEIQAWHSSQRDRRGRVPDKLGNRILTVRQQALDTYIQRKKDLAGLAKSGWVGGLTHVKYTPPKWISRHNAARCRVQTSEIGNGKNFVCQRRNKLPYVSNLCRKSGAMKTLRGELGDSYRVWSKSTRQRLDKLAAEFNKAK